MLDENFRPWFIEINTNPCLETSCPLLLRIIPPMVENAFRIGIDPMFPPPNWPNSKKHLLPDNMLETNKFELIFDEEESGPYLRNVLNLNNQQNRNDPFHLVIVLHPVVDLIYEIDEEYMSDESVGEEYLE